jgi:hypothetical protein
MRKRACVQQKESAHGLELYALKGESECDAHCAPHACDEMRHHRTYNDDDDDDWWRERRRRRLND